jgi:hypothetical protein
MRNRAKCKLCNQIIESYARTDFVSCSCGEISIDGGDQYLKASARDYRNFLRVDDEGNEKPVTFIEKDSKKPDELVHEEKKVASTKEDVLKNLSDMIERIESLPEPAMRLPVDQFDLYSLMLLMKAFLKASA